MKLLRILSVAGLALVLASGCIRISDAPPPPPPPPPPPLQLMKCSEPEQNPRPIVRIAVSDWGEVSPDDEVVCVKTGQVIQWYLTPTAGVTKTLRIKPPDWSPPRFVVTSTPDGMEVHARRTGPPISYEEHKYDIHVWINGVERKVDPILIIRE